MAKISVVLPTYNSVRYLKEALDSIVSQTYPVNEIIVVDDGSTDQTKEAVKTYNVKYIYQDNKGPAVARNRGIKEAKGEYIAFLDSDDLWMPEKIEKEMRLLEDSDYTMVYCDMSHSVNGKLIYRSYLKEKSYKFVSSGDIYENLLRENFIFTPTVLVKKEVFERIGYFDESYRICEDYKMWLRIAKDYKIGYVDEVLAERRRNESNITKDKFLFISSGIRLFEELLSSNNRSPKLKDIIKDEYYRRFYDLGYYYWNRGDISLARENFIKTMKYKKNIFKTMPYVISSYLPKCCINSLREFKSAKS